MMKPLIRPRRSPGALPRAPWTADAMGLGDLKLDDMIVVALVGCLAATTLTMTVLTFRLPNKGAVLKEQGFQVAHGDFCDTLYVSHVRPFRFAIAKYDGTFSCPWPGTNTALRAALSLGGLAATAGEAWFVYREELPTVHALSWAFGLLGAGFLSAATLDADALSAGNALCRDGFKVDSEGDAYHLLTGFNKDDLTCEPAPFAWLVIGDFFCVSLFLAAWYLFYKYSDDDGGRHRTALQDPFLASQMEATYDSSLPNVDADELAGAGMT